jgi:hypothetical protein
MTRDVIAAHRLTREQGESLNRKWWEEGSRKIGQNWQAIKQIYEDAFSAYYLPNIENVFKENQRQCNNKPSSWRQLSKVMKTHEKHLARAKKGLPAQSIRLKIQFALGIDDKELVPSLIQVVTYSTGLLAERFPVKGEHFSLSKLDCYLYSSYAQRGPFRNRDQLDYLVLESIIIVTPEVGNFPAACNRLLRVSQCVGTILQTHFPLTIPFQQGKRDCHA